jgi:hypothetical protein
MDLATMATISLRATITMDDEQIRRYAEARGLSWSGAGNAIALSELAADLQRYVQGHLRAAPAFDLDGPHGDGAKVTVALPHRDQYEQAEPTSEHRARRHRP